MEHYAKRILTGLAVLLSGLVSGTVAFTILEDWTIIESLYFSAVTLFTLGYGDYVPTSHVSRLFALALGALGVGLFVYFSFVITFSAPRPTSKRI